MARTDITSRAIIIKDGKILLMHRRKHKEEYFVLPGGGVEEGETPIETVNREVYEETGLKMISQTPAFDVVDVNGKNVHLFYCELEEGTPFLNGEEKETSSTEDWYDIAWFDLKILNQPNVYPVPARRRLLLDLTA